MQDSVSQVQSIDLDRKAEPDPAHVLCFSHKCGSKDPTWTNSVQVGVEPLSGDIIREKICDDEKRFKADFQCSVYGINCTLHRPLIHRHTKLGISMHD